MSNSFVEQRRKELMFRTSDAERAAIRNCERLGYKVVRQKPIQTGRKLYFADIYLPEIKTIIEVDGGYHFTSTQKRKDKNRSAGMWRLGYHVVRLSNHDARILVKVRAKILRVTRHNIIKETNTRKHYANSVDAKKRCAK